MKSVLISIRPQWCELIASGKKTVEVRKTKPKLETPFKCYIYMTKGDAVYPVTIGGHPYTCSNSGGGVVIGEFVCDRISPIAMTSDGLVDVVDLNISCLSAKELFAYSAGKLPIYGWHISDLKIYDEPKLLYEFQKCPRKLPYDPVTRPPQSWCYVDGMDDA